MHAKETIAPDEAAVTAEFITFLKQATERRDGTAPRRRFNQARATACLEGEFTVPGDLPPEDRVGVFAAARTYQAVIRFANAASESDRDRDVRGMAIKISPTLGDNLTPGGFSQDFVLNSHPVMMVANTREFLDLLRANEAGGFRRVLYFLTHPKAARIAAAARANPTCHLDIPYWSTTPYRFGPDRAVKYIVRPTSPQISPRPATLTDTYLRDALRARLDSGDATFDLLVQFHTDDVRTPIEDASAEWKERDSPPRRVAQIRIPRQRVDDPEREARCEQLSFNPWHSLAEHQPLGNMNRARREIYRAMAEFRGASTERSARL
jgi:catalase